MKKINKIIVAGLLVIFIAGCKSSTVAPASTTPTGGASIGPNGGTITSANGKVSLVIPAGALSSTQSISITTKTSSNTCPQALDSGYDLTPDGLTFSKPAMLTLSYDTTIAGAIAELIGVASQEGTGSWYAWTGGSLDTVHHTVTVPITHFSGETGYLGFAMTPSSAVVFTGSSPVFQVTQVGPPASSPPVPPVALTNPFAVASALWKVNGGAGNSTIGTLSSATGSQVTYMAPQQMPSPDLVTLSATITTNGQTFVVPAFLHVLAQNWTLTGVDSLVYSCPSILTYADVSGGYTDVQLDAGGSGATSFGWFPSGSGQASNEAVCPTYTGQVANFTITVGNGMSLSSIASGQYISSSDELFFRANEQSRDQPGYTVNWNASSVPPTKVTLVPGNGFEGAIYFKNLSTTNTWTDDHTSGEYLENITWTLTAH
jgi:hypothetical protein